MSAKLARGGALKPIKVTVCLPAIALSQEFEHCAGY